MRYVKECKRKSRNTNDVIRQELEIPFLATNGNNMLHRAEKISNNRLPRASVLFTNQRGRGLLEVGGRGLTY